MKITIVLKAIPISIEAYKKYVQKQLHQTIQFCTK